MSNQWIVFELAQDAVIEAYATEIEALRSASTLNNLFLERIEAHPSLNYPRMAHVVLEAEELADMGNFSFEPQVKFENSFGLFVINKNDESEKPWAVINPDGGIFDSYNLELSALVMANAANRSLIGFWGKGE